MANSFTQKHEAPFLKLCKLFPTSSNRVSIRPSETGRWVGGGGGGGLKLLKLVNKAKCIWEKKLEQEIPIFKTCRSECGFHENIKTFDSDISN